MKNSSTRFKKWFIVLLVNAAVGLTIVAIFIFQTISPIALANSIKELPQQFFEVELPKENIPLYKEAGDAYGVPWTLLAAHHRIETKFSTMDPMLSPVGAEGPLQFMPCTFVGWSYPTCSGLGKGDIPTDEKMNPTVIAKYGGYGVDGNNDGTADPYNLTDALYSAAHYLSKYGAADGDVKEAVFHYNQSEAYVKDILHYYQKYEDEYEGK